MEERELGAWDYALVSALSAAGLAYEIILLRVFGYSQWHHFASLAVALALLGFGAAGTALTLLGERAKRWGDQLFLGGALVGAAGMVAAYLTSQAITTRPLFAVWNAGELTKLLVVDFVSFIPFFGFALSIGQSFIRWPEATPRLYASNLLGSGIGSLGAAALLSQVHVEYALMWLPFVVLGIGAAISWIRRMDRWLAGGFASGLAALGIWLSVGLPELPLSDFKRLAYLLDLPDAEVVERRPGLRAELRIVRSDHIRMAPGLSMQWFDVVPSQDALVLGSDRVLPLPRRGASSDYRAATLANLPFLLREEGGAAWLGASDWLPPDLDRPLTWVAENPQVVSSLRSRLSEKGARFLVEDSRIFLDTEDFDFSLIFIAAAAEGGESSEEDYLLTTEGLRAGLNRLRAGGMMAIPMPLSNPPRHAPKLVATAARVLREEGKDPLGRVAMLRSLHASLLVLCVDPLSKQDIETIRSFADRWAFDLVALPGLLESEANRFHMWREPILYRAARSIVSGKGEVPEEASWYALEPPSDKKPYFWRTMRWSELPRLWRELGAQGLVWLDWALLITVAKLLAAGALGAALILLPLRRLPRGSGGRRRAQVWLYFSALGLGYLLVEMAAYQRSIRYLDDPVIAAAVVFAVFLLGSGAGSVWAPTEERRRCVWRIYLPVLLFGVFAFFVLYRLEAMFLAMPRMVRLVCLALLLLPLAWSMGRALPWGLRQLDKIREWIPWAWGINGFASVVAAPAAVLLSVHGSQFATWIGGGVCYVAAGGVALAWTAPAPTNGREE